jgi:hypothetical protein
MTGDQNVETRIGGPQPDDKRYVRRNRKGQFTESDDVGRSLSQDRRRKAKRVAPKGQGDRGDRKRPSTARSLVQQVFPRA